MCIYNNIQQPPKKKIDVLCYFYDSFLKKQICRVGHWDKSLKRWIIAADGRERYYTYINEWQEIPKPIYDVIET